jgi:hypothetical protein
MNDPLFVSTVAEVRQAEDLTALAARINAREGKSRADTVKHVRQQGEDLLKAKAECSRDGRGKRLPWMRENITAVGKSQAYHYMEFAVQFPVTGNWTEEELWAGWQRIQGNAPTDDADDAGDGVPADEPDSDDDTPQDWAGDDDDPYYQAWLLTKQSLDDCRAMLVAPGATAETAVRVSRVAGEVIAAWHAAKIDAMTGLGELLRRGS